MTMLDDAVDDLEGVFTDYVTRTPIKLKFTASEIADDLGCDTAWVSQALQNYRYVQSGHSLSTSAFVVATFNRGARSEWFILTWPHMTRAQQTMGGELLVTHEIMSFIKEDIAPMVRNITHQFIPAYRTNRATNRPMKLVLIGKLEGYVTTLMRFRQDLTHVRPMALRRQAQALDAVLTDTINDCDSLRMHLQVI